MAASNTRFTQNSLGQSKTPIDSDHGIYRDRLLGAGGVCSTQYLLLKCMSPVVADCVL